MSLKLYLDNEATHQLSDYDITTTHNGFVGGSDVFSVFIKNTDENKSYLDVKASLTLEPEVSAFSWKAYYGSDILSEQEWNEIDEDTEVSLGDITNVVNVHQVQFRLHCKAGSESEVYKSFKVKITAVESINND